MQRAGETTGETTPAVTVRARAAHFGDGLKRLPAKLRDLGTRDFEVSSPFYSGRRFGKAFATPISKETSSLSSSSSTSLISSTGSTPPVSPPPGRETFLSAATSSHRTDADMGRVMESFAPSGPAPAADAAHTRARRALSDEAAFLAEASKRFRAAGSNPAASPDAPTPDTPTDPRALCARIAELFGGPVAAASELPYADAMTCADAIASATGGDAALADAVLDRLQLGLDFSRPAPATTTMARNAERCAWRAAQLMAGTSSGYEALRRVAGSSWPQGDGVRYAPRVLLRAGDAIVRASHGDPSPSEITRQAQRWLVDPAADPTQRHLATMALGASRLWRTGNLAALTPEETGAVFAGRNGYMTDGPGTAFAKVKSRLFKTIDTSIPRASDSRWKSALPRVVGKQKSAFAVLGKGIHSAHLDIVEKERAALQASTQSAVEALATERGADGSDADATRSLEAIVRRMTQTGTDAVSVLVERAEIAHWASRPSLAYGEKLGDEDFDAIARNVRETFARLPIPSAAAPPAQREAWMALRRFTTTLRRASQTGGKRAWAPLRAQLAKGGATLDIDKLDALAKRYPGAKEAAAADWKTIERIARAAPIKPKGLSAEAQKAALDELADTMKSGGKVVLVDGGQVGISTAGLSSNVGKLLHAGGIVVSPRLNLRVRGGRQAFAEYGRRTACFYFSAGSQDRVAFDAGAGVQVGGDYLIVRAGVTANVVAYQTDRLNRNAFSLIVARRMKADGSGFDDKRLQRGMVAVNAFMFDHARDRDLTDDETAWQALAQRFIENDDFSVVWNEQHQNERRHGVNVSGGVSFKASVGEVSARLGPQFGYAYDYASKNVADSVDTGGTTAVESHRSGRGGRHIASAGLSTSLGDSPHATEGLVNFGLLSSDFPMVRYRIRDRQHVAKMSLVREEGKLVHRVSYADTEFAHFDDYAHAIRNDERWALMFGLDPDNPAMPSGANRDALLARGRERIESHLAQVKADHKDNQILFHRFRLREHAAKGLDAYAERAAALRANGAGEQEITQWEQDYAELLARPDSWLPVEFKVYERVGRQSSPGINFGLRATLEQSATGERELISMIHKPPQIDAIDRIWPRDEPDRS
ncbi:hypothetical protein C0Z18_22625 [Trinickia dabaoshanensis]|uniref:Autotransporter n=1 Tax=Trinickia dabaoshanensis TaxID=564714 RepID=A0A2N7VHK9_9BURK|nr:hypothetical protein C0Z18_22625 [Trinickia dabaoshanensis]